ncbi:MAG TPA: outer membrane lipoprotein carrier protein LolA [Bacteroidales bacterium]|jgi:outer membrane lipoprotein-sorting protein|nr:outer membrane lipoprotein carrier protein LolA [Bacteroidales bacterium]
MRNILLISLALINTVAFSQENKVIQDPAAGQVLERVARKTKTLLSLQTDFELVIHDRKEGTTNKSTGKLLLKQSKYKLNSEGSIVFFDGKTMWTFVSENNEVTITEPETTKGNFLNNPSTFFDSYKEDFKYRYVREAQNNGVACHEIDLFPKNLNQPFSRIKVLVNTKTDLPESISSIGKDGVDYTVNLKNLVLDQNVPDTEFTFNPAKYKKVEVIDMRGL